MAFLGIFGNYDKPGPGVEKDEAPKPAPVRFFQILGRKFSKLIQANLIFMIPAIVAAVLMVFLYFFPTHPTAQLAVGDGSYIQMDLWARYVVPLPLVLLYPFLAGLTYIARNFAREEHAFVWSDFWDAVKNNWKLFLINGAVLYLAYIILSFAMTYYYYQITVSRFFYVPFWICIVITVVLLFAQYYLPVIFITFDLTYRQAFKNSLIFSVAGFARNILLTVIFGGLAYVILNLIPIMALTVMIMLLVLVLIFFSFCSFLTNFTVYSIIDKYMIQPYQQKLEEEKKEKAEPDPVEEQFPGLFAQEGEEDEDKMVYVNGRLIRQSELNGKKKNEEE